MKYWEYAAGQDTLHDTKSSTTVEVTLILEGEVRGHVGGETLTLTAGEYVVIPPRVVNNLVVDIVQDAAGITIKAPSARSAKTVLP